MESSSLVSWQSENFSAAELSPPISPVPPSSPQFYDGSNPSSPSLKGLLHNTDAMLLQSQKPLLSPVLSSRAQSASIMLDELERLNCFENQNAYGIGFKEDSVDLNMNLFEELADIEYTPPLFSSDDSVEVPHSPAAASPVPMVPHVVVSSPSVDNSGLSAEFKTIVESLKSPPPTTSNKVILSAPSRTSKAVASFGDLIQIAGIPTTTIGDECLVPVEFIGRPTAGGLGAEEAESMDLDGIIISNEMTLINERELFGLGLEELSGELITDEVNSVSGKTTLVNGVLPYWAKDMTIPVDELDTQMNRNVETLDALLKGDVSTAKHVITSASTQIHHAVAYSPVSSNEEEEDENEMDFVETKCIVVEEVSPKPVVESQPQKKSERRGRKPAKLNKDPLTYIRDKALRKKEQNKTAATRYRQKKKQELVTTLAEEDELQSVHDELEKEKEKVGAEVRMIRSLLRDMLQVRKKRISPSLPASVPISASKITASQLVQAQRIANRRK